jgi:L-2-hydroxyglutarate oxidase
MHRAAQPALPAAGITDYVEVGRKYAELRAVQNGQGVHSYQARGLVCRKGGTTVETIRLAFQMRSGINCAGLQSDCVTRLARPWPEVVIVPFRGETLRPGPGKRIPTTVSFSWGALHATRPR